MILPEEVFKRANAELDRIAKELGLSGEVVNDARAELLKQLHADPFLHAVITAPLPQGSNGRFDELSVEDIRFLAALEIDILTEAPPDRREWKPRAEEI